MNAAILALALLGQANVETERRVDDGFREERSPNYRMTSPTPPSDLASRRAAYLARKAAERERQREYRAQQQAYAREYRMRQAQQRAYARRYRIANRPSYQVRFAQQAAAMRSAGYGLHLAATARVYDRRQAPSCTRRRYYLSYR